MERNELALPPTSCDGCGLCCHTQPRPPFMPTELDVLPPALARDLEAPPTGRRASTTPCTWLSAGGQCAHYHHRPTVCREFEMGGEDCLQVRREGLRKG